MGLSNALVALSGAIVAQYQGFADASLGTGMVVSGLAMVMIGRIPHPEFPDPLAAHPGDRRSGRLQSHHVRRPVIRVHDPPDTERSETDYRSPHHHFPHHHKNRHQEPYPEAEGEMITFDKVGLIFGEGTPDRVEALRNIDLHLDKGDFITVIGSNGAGKSSLFNALSGLYPPTDGKIIRNETDITRWPEYRRASFIGRVFQDPLMGTAGNMSVQDNLTIASYKGMKKLRISLNRKKKSEFRDMLSQLEMGLEDRMEDNVGQLSGGQRQALTMLMMVLSSPDLVLLDEHTAALDPRNAARVLELTDRFFGEYGLTLMMVTHDMKMALDHGNRLLMMDRGEIILEARDSEKDNLTVEELVKRFHDIRGTNLTNDEALLS